MDMTFTEHQVRWRSEVDSFLDKEVTPEVIERAERMEYVTGPFSLEFSKKLAEKGWLALSWPEEYGGQGRDYMDTAILEEQLGYYWAPIDAHRTGCAFVANGIMEHGTAEQKKRVLPPIARQEVVYCEAYTEPEAGTDLASLKARAVRDGNDYIVNGEKTFCSGFHFADYMHLAARTDPAATKHRGISMFIVDVRSPGITGRPMKTINHGIMTMNLIQKIALREGFGDVLAEGSVRAAQTIGKGAHKYVMTTKGMEMMSQDPRSGRRGFVFGDLTNPRGGDNLRNTHGFGDRYNPEWSVDKFDMFDDIKKRVYTMPPQEAASTWEGKPLMCKWFEDLYSVINSLGLCIFPSGMNMALGPTHFARLLSAATGWDTTPQEIMTSGERIFTLFKAYTVREGLTRKDDTWPERFFTEPMPEGPSKGAVLSHETVDKLLDEYYRARGWDLTSGIPTYDKLVGLGLKDVADGLGLRREP